VLVFLKLGGSLITDKTRPHTPATATLARLADEIQRARRAAPDLQLLIGHGSGSFGHVAGKKHGTRQGVHGREQWLGFAEVWQEARALNQIVLEALCAAGLPVVAFPPSGAALAADGEIAEWDLRPLRAALQAGLVPLVYGDVAFDTRRGGTILSTETLFRYLAAPLQPERILLAGLESGVWADFPACTQLLPLITPASDLRHSASVGGALAVDVTGGMAQKVDDMLELVQRIPGLEALIFSATQPGLLEQALLGAAPGTRICQTL